MTRLPLSLRFWSFLGSIKSKVKRRQIRSNERTYCLPAGGGAARSGETGQSPLWGFRILTQCECLHEKTAYESTQRSQPTSFAIFWASDGWSRLTRRTRPAKRCIHLGIQRGVRHWNTPSDVLLKNQWYSTKKNNLKEFFRKPYLPVDNRLDLQQGLLKVPRPCAKRSVICWRRNYDV